MKDINSEKAEPSFFESSQSLRQGRQAGQAGSGQGTRLGEARVANFDRDVGHLRYFFTFSIMKNDFIAFFIKLITNFCTSPI